MMVINGWNTITQRSSNRNKKLKCQESDWLVVEPYLSEKYDIVKWAQYMENMEKYMGLLFPTEWMFF